MNTVNIDLSESMLDALRDGQEFTFKVDQAEPGIMTVVFSTTRQMSKDEIVEKLRQHGTPYMNNLAKQVEGLPDV